MELPAYEQKLHEFFGILTLHLPIDSLQKIEFVQHFNAPNSIVGHNWFTLRNRIGQPFAQIDVYEFIVPFFKLEPGIEFDLSSVFHAFKSYMQTQEQVKAILNKQELDKLNAPVNPNNFFGNNNYHTTSREVNLSDIIPQIDYSNAKIAPNIPNIGKASL